MKRLARLGFLTLNCLLGSWTVASSAPPASPIVNGGFEDGILNPWFQGRVASGGEDWHVTNSDAHSGTFSATNTGNKEIRQNFAPIPAASIQEFSFFAKHVGPGVDMNVIFYILPGPDSNLNANLTTTTSGVWQKFDVTTILGHSAILTGFSIYGNSAGDPNFTRTYLDDVTIIIPEPSSLMLCFIAIGGPFILGRYSRSAVQR